MNLATYDLREAMNLSSAPLRRGHSEFEHAGLEMAESRIVAAPRVAASPCSMECKVTQTLELRDLRRGSETLGAWTSRSQARTGRSPAR